MEIIIGLLVLALVGYVVYSKKICCNKTMESPMEESKAMITASSEPMAAPKEVTKKAPAKKVTKAPAAKKVAAKGKTTSATKGKK